MSGDGYSGALVTDTAQRPDVAVLETDAGAGKAGVLYRRTVAVVSDTIAVDDDRSRR